MLNICIFLIWFIHRLGSSLNILLFRIIRTLENISALPIICINMSPVYSISQVISILGILLNDILTILVIANSHSLVIIIITFIFLVIFIILYFH
jgi:hypothetical protein